MYTAEAVSGDHEMAGSLPVGADHLALDDHVIIRPIVEIPLAADGSPINNATPNTPATHYAEAGLARKIVGTVVRLPGELDGADANPYMHVQPDDGGPVQIVAHPKARSWVLEWLAFSMPAHHIPGLDGIFGASCEIYLIDDAAAGGIDEPVPLAA